MTASRLLDATRLYKTKKSSSDVAVTFVDDDGKATSWTRIKAVAEDKGVPFVLALVSTTSYLTVAQVLYMQNSMGFEIASHSVTHTSFNELTTEDLTAELVNSKAALEANGYAVNNMVYPYGDANESVQTETAKYYNCGATAGASIQNTRPVSLFFLRRNAFGVYTIEGQDTLAYYKSVVDDAITNSAWLIWMLHSNDHNETQQGYLYELIEYVKEQGVRIVTLQQGYEAFN